EVDFRSEGPLARFQRPGRACHRAFELAIVQHLNADTAAGPVANQRRLGLRDFYERPDAVAPYDYKERLTLAPAGGRLEEVAGVDAAVGHNAVKRGGDLGIA